MNLSTISTQDLERELNSRQNHEDRQREIFTGDRQMDTEDHLDDSHLDHGNRAIGFWRAY
jgi:hypothetical protein